MHASGGAALEPAAPVVLAQRGARPPGRRRSRSARAALVRSSYIRATNGTSNGLIPMLRVYNNTARFVSQGGGKRQGSFAVYLEPWHGDIFEFLDLKKNHGKEEA